jgi:hypothetical protein
MLKASMLAIAPQMQFSSKAFVIWRFTSYKQMPVISGVHI